MTIEVEWARMTAPDLREIAAGKNALAILPIGSLEQHGPHLPVILGATSANGDPDNILSFFLVCSAISSSNMSNWCYKPMDDLLQLGRVTTDGSVANFLFG